MILRTLVRADFEKKGRFDNPSFMDMLVEFSQERGMGVRDSYFHILGYKHDDVLSSYERYKFRKMFCQGKRKELMKVFKVDKHTKLVSSLKDFDCMPERTIPNIKKDLDKEEEKIARVLSLYYSYSDDKRFRAGDREWTFGEYLKRYRFTSKRKDISELLLNKKFRELLNNITPRIDITTILDSPKISQQVLFSHIRLDADRIEEIKEKAVLHSICRILDVPEQIYFHVTKVALDFQKSSEKDYLILVDYAHSLGKTVEELFDLCGLNYVDNLKVYENTGCIFYLVGENQYEVISSNSKTETDRVYLNRDQIDKLNSMGSLKTLAWDERDGRPFIYYDRVYYLNDIFVGQEDYN